MQRNDYLNDQLLRVVRLHAEASTNENRAAFYMTPAQAALSWWGLYLLLRALRDSANACGVHGDYADNLRCHADAVEVSKRMMAQLWAHAKDHSLEPEKEGLGCY